MGVEILSGSSTRTELGPKTSCRLSTQVGNDKGRYRQHPEAALGRSPYFDRPIPAGRRAVISRES
jgi:hypothetical protein